MSEVQAVQPVNKNYFNQQKTEFVCKPGLAQYGGSDYKNAVRVERRITLEEAKKIAANDPEIDYFFIMTGAQMILDFNPGPNYDRNKEDPLWVSSKQHSNSPKYLKTTSHRRRDF